MIHRVEEAIVLFNPEGQLVLVFYHFYRTSFHCIHFLFILNRLIHRSTKFFTRDTYILPAMTPTCSPVSLHIVLMRTNVIHLLNRVSEHDSLTVFVLHRTKCK